MHHILRGSRNSKGHAEIEVASNPEFLREGSAIDDFKRPDRVIVGAETEHARETMKSIYRPLALNQISMLITGLETAELIKYASNAFLATKITFINEIADLCERVGAGRSGSGAGGSGWTGASGRSPASRAGLWRLVFPQGHAGAA